IRIARLIDARATTTRMTALARANSGLNTSKPASWPKKIVNTGITATAEICCAVRGSLTLDEIATIAVTAIITISGTQRIRTISHPGLTTAISTRRETVTSDNPVTKITPHIQVITTAGIPAARHLPKSNSPVVTG